MDLTAQALLESRSKDKILTMRSALLMAILGCSLLRGQGPSLILFNGRVFTGMASRPFVDALAITGERISAVGTTAEIRAEAGPFTTSVNLQGRFAIPGFNDAHTHFVPALIGKILDLKGLDLSCPEALKALRDAAREEPTGTVITGVISATAFFDERCTPAVLSKIAPADPVMFRTWTPHAVMLNSAMSRKFSVDENDPPVAGGFFGKNMQSLHWDGVVHEFSAIPLYARLIDRTSEAAVLRDFLNSAARRGITSIQILSAPEDPERLVHLIAAIDSPIRVRVIPYPFTNRSGRLGPLYPVVPPGTAGRVRVDGVKWLLDGTPIERSAALRHAYADDPAWSGAMNFSRSELQAILQEVRNSDTPLLVHTVGDRTTEAFLQAMEQTGGRDVWNGQRVRIEHGDGLMPDLIPRTRELGVVVVVNPTHLTLGSLAVQRFGASGIAGRQPLRALLDAGIPLAIGSDGEMNPGLNLMLAASYPARPTDALTREQVIKAYTATAAYAEFQEREKGTLEPGKLADIAVLSQDIFNVPIQDLPKTHAELTIVGGKIVFREK